MEKMVTGLEFYKGKRVLVTGHTGFKGSWLCKILLMAGAEVTGFALKPNTEPSIFEIIGLEKEMKSVIADIRDFNALEKAYKEANPEIVFHLAAQPIVRTSYEEPRYTYETNVMGTVNLLECVRLYGAKSVLNVTTDKVYLNNERNEAFSEDEPLDGFDPYSNSKSCSELVTHSYVNSFFKESGIAVSTARAGNVIGGGDFSRDRIIPDCVRAASENETIIVRNPHSIRPYQHVLEPLFAYLMIAKRQYEDSSYAGYYNVGPDETDCKKTDDLVDVFCLKWGENAKWENRFVGGPHEASFLKLDCSKLKKTFGWKPCWNVEKAIEKTVKWSKAYYSGENAEEVTKQQITEFFKENYNV